MDWIFTDSSARPINGPIMSYVYITIIFVILLSRYYNGSIHSKCMRAYRQNKIHCWRGANDRMCVRWCWGGGVRDGRESVWVCALSLRRRDAKFRCSSLQRLIEYRRLRGDILYHHTHIHTYTSHLSQRDGGGVHNMRTVSFEMGVLLLLDNEGQVVRGVAEHLMTLLGEGDPGALLPPLLHLYVEHALFWSQGVFVCLPEACQFHTLRHAH